MNKTFAAALPIAFPLFLTILNFSAPKATITVPPTQALRVSYAALAEGPATLPEHSVVLTVDEGDTLGSVFAEGGLDRAQSASLNREFGRFIDLRRLRPGHLVRFHYNASGTIDTVEMKVSGWGEIDAVRGPNGFAVAGHEVPMREIETTVAANIDTSLYEALRTSGESPQLVQQLADLMLQRTVTEPAQ